MRASGVKMKTYLIYAIALVGSGVSAIAQDRGGERRGPGPRGPQRMFAEIRETLGLDDAQREKLDEILTANRERWQRQRSLRQEIRSARRDGDEERAAELETQLQDRAASFQKTLDEIETILDSKQREAFSEIRQDIQQRIERRQAGPGQNRFEGRHGLGGPGPQRMFGRMAETLELNEEQRVQFDDIAASFRQRFAEARPILGEMRQARRDGDTARADELRAQLHELSVDPGGLLQNALNDVGSILDDEQLPGFSEIRQNMEQRQWERELPETLEMDEEQRAQYRQMRRALHQGQRPPMDLLRSIRRKMREAREADDQARVQELQAELEAARPDATGKWIEFLDQLRGVLREDQAAVLDPYYLGTMAGAARRHEDAHDLLRAALRSRLDRAQRAKWRVIMRETIESLRAHRKDKEAGAAIAVETRGKIEELLTEDQLVLFERALKRLKRSNRQRVGTRLSDPAGK